MVSYEGCLLCKEMGHGTGFAVRGTELELYAKSFFSLKYV